MKRFSKIYLPLLIVALTLLCVLGLSACGDSCEHVWKQGVTVNPGCEHEGAIAYTCEVCGEIKTELVDPTGHSFTNYVDDGNATCEIEGTKTAVCDNENCGKTDTKSVPKRHVYSESWTQSPDGHYHACTVCGASDGLVAHTPNETGDACTVCGYDIHVHSAAKVEAKAPTCIAEGNVEYWYCASCETYYLDEALTEATTAADVVLATVAHSYSDKWTTAADGHWHACEVCGAEEPDSKAAHISSGAATDTTDEICTVCFYIITPALNHTHEGAHVPAKDKTCTEDGNVECWYCEGCDRYFANEALTQYLSDEERIIKAGHDAEHREALAASCLADGYLEHWYCADCDTYFSDAHCKFPIAYAVIAKPAKHTAITWFASTPVGCEKDGNIAYWYCSDCGKYYTDSAHKNEVTEADTVIAKLGHNAAYVGGKAATCTEKGTKEYWTCINCGKNYKDASCKELFNLADLVIESLGHKAKATPDEIIKPTCLEGGYSIFSCEREGCGHKIKNNFTPVGDCNEIEIATTGASCQSAGSITYKCTVCEAERTVYTAKTDHNYVTEVIAPGCVEAGYTKHTCKTEGCGYSYKDNEVAATGHNWKDTVVDATCTEAGSITASCDACGASTTSSIAALGHDVHPTCEASDACGRDKCDYVAPATGHNYIVAELVPATCTENGYVKYECANEGCSQPTITDYPEDYNAKGHAAAIDAVWTETEVAVEGEACTYQVVRTAPCAACGETVETRGEKYLEHKIAVSIKTPATCSVPGVKVHTCSVCETVIDDNVSYSDPEAHTWGEGVLQDDEVTTVYTCSCGATKKSVSAKQSTEAKVDSETVKNSDDVELKNATFVPDSSIKDTLTGEVEFGAEAKDKSEFNLDTDVLDRIGDNPIYDFTMTVNGTPAKELGGTMTVRIPYDLGDEDPENIMVWYINGDKVVEVKATYVEIDGQGYAVFDTDHFSYYTVTKMKPAERCKLYGHTVKDIEVPATCLTEGYTMHVCTRCGETKADGFVDALGHEFVINEETYVELTCSVNGYAEYACSRCGVDYEVRETATGHDFVKDTERSIPATCSESGINVFGCSRCDAEKEEFAPAIAHTYRAEVVAPTCTEGGYTLKVCRICNFSDITDRKDALGHDMKHNVVAPTCIDDGYTESYCARCDKQFENSSIVKSEGKHVWNLENASCTEDMICTACGERSAKATGHSFGTDGICTNDGCNERCAHEYSYLKDVEATCTKRAHKLHQCSICFGTKEVEYTGDPIAHEMENGVCKVCGISSSTYYLAMLQSWKNVDGFALKIEDLAFSMDELVEEESPWYAIIGSADMQLAELMIYVDENGNLAGAARGALSVTSWQYGKQVQIYSVNAVIENGNVYIELTETVGEHGASDTSYMTVSIDYIIGALVEEAVGLKREGVSEIVDFIDAKLLPIINEYVDVNAADIDDVIESLIDLVFTEEMTDDGYVYILDFNKIHAINNDLADLTVSEFVDKYFGESSFADLVATVKEIAGTKLSGIPALLDSYGVNTEKLVAFINEVAAMSGAPEGFDILAMINSDDMKDVLVAELIMEGGYEELEGMIDGIVEMLTSASLYDLAAGEEKDDVRKAVSGVIDEISEVIYFSFSTDSARRISSLTFEIKELTADIMDEGRINLSVSVDVTPNGRINVNFDSIIDEINTSVKYPDLEPLDEGDLEYGEMGDCMITVGGAQYEAEAMWAIAKKYSVDFSSPFATMVAGHCGTRYYTNLVYVATEKVANVYFYMLENGWLVAEDQESKEQTVMVMGENGITITYPDGSTKTLSMEDVDLNSMESVLMLAIADSWYGEERISYENVNDLYIFYDKATGEYEIVSSRDELHDYVLDESKSVINDECGSSSYYHYVCSECGQAHGEYRTNYHDYEWKTVLAEGATSCEDGLIEIEYCAKCDEILYTNELEESYHRTNTVRVWDAETNTLYEEYECACGYEKGKDKRYTVDYDGEITYGDLDTDHISRSELISFTVSEDGIYQFYGKNTMFSVDLYDAAGNTVYAIGANRPGTGMGGGIIDSKPDYDFGYGEITFARGSAYELKAGETYYAYVYANMTSDYSDKIITIELRESTEYSLADYGCTCGATMTVYNEFGRDNVSFSGCQDGCALSYEVVEMVGIDEECREVSVRTVVFHTESGDKEFVVSTYFTGNFKHDGYGRWTNTRTEAVGNDGKLVILATNNYYVICNECGKLTYKETTVEIYDKKSGREIGRRYESYVLNRDGELTLERTEEERFAIIDYIDGSSEEKCIYREYFQYNRATGEITDGESYAYTYYPANKCLVSVVSKDYHGNVREYDRYDHRTSEKLIKDESGEGFTVDEQGRELRVSTNAYETYCTVCYASISKNVTIDYTSVDGSYHKTVTERYDPYAFSEDVYGYVLSTVHEREKGTVVGTNGRSYDYTISEYNAEYKEGELSYWYKHEYRYNYGDYCHYDAYYSSIHSPEPYLQGENLGGHKEMREQLELMPGATNCNDGLNVYAVCLVCGYREFIREEYDYGHHSHSGSSVVYDLSEYGSVCGGTVTVYSCPCGEAKDVTVDRECDFDLDIEPIKLENGYGERHTYSCAVNEPLCGFTYTYEYRYYAIEDCKEYYESIYKFGDLVISYGYETGGYRHSCEGVDLGSNEYYEGEFKVVEYSDAQVCKNCGFYRSESVFKYYYDENDSEVKRTEIRRYFNDDKTVSAEEEREWHNISTRDGKRHESFIVRDIRREYSRSGEMTYERVEEYDRYGSDCPWAPIYTSYTNQGDYEQFPYDHEEWVYTHMGYDPAPTCTQYGYVHEICDWCGDERITPVTPYDHNFNEMKDEETGLPYYACGRCGLESELGNNGSVSLEDLTAKLGGGSDFVIGYWNKENIPYIFTVALVLAGTEEFVELDVEPYYDDGSKVYISIADVVSAVAAKAEADGAEYSICKDSVRIVFLPVGGSDFDYSITLDPHVLEAETEFSYDNETGLTRNHTLSCKLCDYSEEKVSCSCECSYDNGYYVYSCRECGLVYREGNYTTSSGCIYYEHRTIERLIDGEWVSVYDGVYNEYSKHEYDYAYKGLVNGEAMHTMTCSACK